VQRKSIFNQITQPARLANEIEDHTQ